MLHERYKCHCPQASANTHLLSLLTRLIVQSPDPFRNQVECVLQQLRVRVYARLGVKQCIWCVCVCVCDRQREGETDRERQ